MEKFVEFRPGSDFIPRGDYKVKKIKSRVGVVDFEEDFKTCSIQTCDVKEEQWGLISWGDFDFIIKEEFEFKWKALKGEEYNHEEELKPAPEIEKEEIQEGMNIYEAWSFLVEGVFNGYFKDEVEEKAFAELCENPEIIRAIFICKNGGKSQKETLDFLVKTSDYMETRGFLKSLNLI